MERRIEAFLKWAEDHWVEGAKEYNGCPDTSCHPFRKQRIRQFWHGCLHALMSVKGGYSLYAVDTSNGAAACAWAPKFEAVASAAPSFLEFLELVTTGRVKI